MNIQINQILAVGFFITSVITALFGKIPLATLFGIWALIFTVDIKR